MAEVSPDSQVRAARFNVWRRALLRRPAQLLRAFFGASSAAASLYWGLFNGGFGREHRAVLAGMRAYEAVEGDGAANRFLLRRNTHRLEKGLIMRPRRGLFALGYIEATVDVYERALVEFHTGAFVQEDLQWAHDVLRKYFSVVDAHPVVDELRSRFEALPPCERAGPEAVPYARDLSGAPPVEYADFRALTRRRRSVRWFLDTPVPHELVDQALEAAFEAPSACNRQPFIFRIFDEPDRVREILEMPAGTKGFAHNVPMVCVIIGQLRAYPEAKDRHLIYIDGSLAAMGFMFALETLGLSSCPINWPDVASREKTMKSALGLEADQRPVMLMAIGYPDPEGAVPFSQKQPLSSLRSFNR
ncbi:MAG: nitroreductase [Bradymonadia bacterium]|jgi:nitroreductase